ncbi:unnamed protein product [Hanseniaspora opuntiae]
MSETKNHVEQNTNSNINQENDKRKDFKKSSYQQDFQHGSNAEVFLNLYSFKPSTVPPFALIMDSDNKNGTNTQKRFNQKRHAKQKEKTLKTHEGRSMSSSPVNGTENEESSSSDTPPMDQISHWNTFMGNLNYVCPSNDPNPSYELKSNSVNLRDVSESHSIKRRSSIARGSSTTSSSDTHSDANFDEKIVLNPGDVMYKELLPNLDERWKGSDRMKIMESIPLAENIGFKNQQEKNQFNNYVSELKACFYEGKNYNADWNFEKMEEERNNMLLKSDLKDKDIHPSSFATDRSYSRSLDRQGSRSQINGHPNYGNMEPKDLEKVYQKEHGTYYGSGPKFEHFGNKNYHLTMLQKKDNLTAYFKQQYGRKKTELFPRIEKILFQNRYLPLLCRFMIVVLCTVALSLSARIYINSKSHYFGRDLDEPLTAELKKYTMGQQPSTIMAMVINTISILFEVYVAVNEFNGEPIGLRNPLGKLRLLLLDLFFIIFFSANLSIAFGSMFDDDWVCIGGYPSNKSSPKVNYICRKQRTLSSFLFLILCAWVITFTVSITRVVNRVSSLQR